MTPVTRTHRRLPSRATLRPGAGTHHWIGVSGGITTYDGAAHDEEHCVHCGLHRQIVDDWSGVHRYEVWPEEHGPLCENGHPECERCGTVTLTLEAAQREPRTQAVIAARDALERELQGHGFTWVLEPRPSWADWEWHDCRWWGRPEAALEVQLFETYPRTGTLRYRVILHHGYVVLEERPLDLARPPHEHVAQLAEALEAATQVIRSAVAAHACGAPDCAQTHRPEIARLIYEARERAER